MKICYEHKRFSQGTLYLIEKANEIVNEYTEQGYSLTVRQVYYQFVARDLIPNEEKWYKRIVRTISDARIAGLLDWTSIEDRTRSLRSLSTWDSPKDVMQSAADSYLIDMWENQSYRVEVWIEKDALIGVISAICNSLRVSYFSCRGYTSQSSLWRASRRIRSYGRAGQDFVLLHLGDHDPSGIDMTRDITDRLTLFVGEPIDVRRIALTMKQIDEHNPPPNPTKITDTRSGEYIRKWGNDCWELDALNPQVITELINKNVLDCREEDYWEVAMKKERKDTDKLLDIVNNLE